MQVDYVYLHFCLINSYKWRCITIAREVQHEINEEIRDREVRVIDANGEMLGVMPTKEAQKLADEKSLDLVKVSPNAKPPVCKILDYGKFRYEEMRRVIRMSVRVEEHDIMVKIKNCIKFLEQGNRVKVSIRFRGREMAYTDQGRGVLLDFAERVTDYGTVDKPPKMEGRSMVMFLSPKKDK